MMYINNSSADIFTFLSEPSDKHLLSDEPHKPLYEDNIILLDVFSGFYITNQLVYSGFFRVMTEFAHECDSD